MLRPISATLRMVCLKAQTTESMKILNCGAGIWRYAEEQAMMEEEDERDKR